MAPKYHPIPATRYAAMRGLMAPASPVATAGVVETDALAAPLARPEDAGQVKTVTVPPAPVVVVPPGAGSTEPEAGPIGGTAEPAVEPLSVDAIGAGRVDPDGLGAGCPPGVDC